ncbi:MAG: ribonuclease III [Candidatus Desulforudis sp.]|nr:ribonuclease III [Desulforudis sp.]
MAQFPGLAEVQQKSGLFWREQQLLREALTHSSYSYEQPGERHNQRLEFLGDAVLEIVVSEHLYRRLPDAAEGELTKIRAAVVCEPTLAQVARELDLGYYLRMGRGEELSGGRERASVLADAFEAFLGALYLDQGLEVTRRFTLDKLGPLITDTLAGKGESDYKTRLQELLQKKSPEPLRYVIINEEGPDHSKVFTAGVVYRGRVLGRGTGRTKKEAEQHAAKEALVGFLNPGHTF